MNIVRPSILKPSTIGIHGSYRSVGYRAIRLLKPEFVFEFARDNGIELGRWEEGLLRRAELALLRKQKGFEKYLKDFIVGGEKFFDFVTHNTVVNEGLNYILDGNLSNTLYLGFIGATPTVSAGHTAAQIGGTNGWSEVTDYDETPRQTWTTGAAASQSRSNSTAVTITCTTGSTFGGAFIIDNSTKGGTTGTLVCGEAFTEGNKALSAGESLATTYTLSASDN